MNQIEDDFELLDLMLNDTSTAPVEYQPTNYWANYEKLLIPELKKMGLKDFRRRKNSVLSSFGATDLLPITGYINHLPIWGIKSKSWLLFKYLSKIKFIDSFFYRISSEYTGISIEDLNRLCYEFARLYGIKTGAKPLENLEVSDFGNPESLFSIKNKKYTLSILNYYIQYAYCCQFIDFNKINSFAEIGSGSGKQIEVIKKLHPNIDFYLFDIPPQEYVCEQYLKALFPDSVISYRGARKISKIENKNNGYIYIFPTWKISDIKNFNYDLFWNSGSFQEMEPEIVLNYLNFVNNQTNKGIFLNETMDGKEVAAKVGNHGVLNPTKMSHYTKGLKNFNLIDQSNTILVTNMNKPSSFTFWEKNAQPSLSHTGSQP